MSRSPVTALLLILAVVVAFGLLATLEPPSPRSDVHGGSPGDGSRVTPTPPPMRDVEVVVPPYLFPALVATLVVALAGSVAVLLVNAEVSLDRDDESQDDDVDLEAVGRAAGEAADRIEAEADLTNEVYRAWYELTRLFDVSDPETTAPDEFTDHAITAGIDPDDVRELTTLFEEVRYGQRDPERREDRAVAALRRIESTYVANVDDGESGDDGDRRGDR